MTLDDTLLKEFTENLVIMDRTTIADGFGGFNVVWQEGATFTAALTSSQNGTAKIAEAITATKIFKVVTETTVTLLKDMYFKRLKDGTVFKILRNNTDKLTPDNSAISMRATEAEITELPT